MKLDSEELRTVGKMDDANDVDVGGCDGDRAAAAPGKNNNADDDDVGGDNDNDDKDDDGDPRIPIDRGWAWFISFGSCVIYLLGNAHNYVVPVLMLDIKTALGTSLSMISIALSVGFFTHAAATQLSVHVLMDKVSTRTLTTIALGVNCVLTLVFAAFPMTEVFMVVHPLKLAMQGIFDIPMLALVGFYFKRHRALALTITTLGVTAGGIVIPPLTRFLKLEYGFQGCFILISGVEMHGVCAAMLLRPLNNYVRKRRPTVSGAEEKGILPDKDKTKSGPEYELVSTVDTEHTKFTGAEGVTIISESDIDMSSENNQDAHARPGLGASLLGDNSCLEMVGEKENGQIGISSIPRDVENNGVLNGVSRTRRRRTSSAPEGISVASAQSASSLSLRTGSALGSHCALGSIIDLNTGQGVGTNHDQPNGLFRRRLTTVGQGVWSCINHAFYWSLLKNPLCLLCMITFTLAHGGWFTRTYLTAYATTVGVAETKAALLLTVAGTAEIVSMIGMARVADSKILRPHQIIGAASLCIGVVTQFIPSFTQFVPLLVMAIMDGLLSAVGVTLGPVLMVDLLGLELLPKTLGLCSIVVSFVLGAEFALVGALVDLTGGTSVAFHYAGTSFLLAFIFHFLNPFIRWLRTGTCRQRETQ